MGEHIGLLLPASVIIHLVNILLLKIPLAIDFLPLPPFIHISVQCLDENALRLIFRRYENIASLITLGL